MGISLTALEEKVLNASATYRVGNNMALPKVDRLAFDFVDESTIDVLVVISGDLDVYQIGSLAQLLTHEMIVHDGKEYMSKTNPFIDSHYRPNDPDVGELVMVVTYQVF